MDNSTLVNSEKFAFGGVKKGEKLAAFERKKLSDISNLHERPKPMNLDPKKKSTTTITSMEYIEKLQKENDELTKLVADRNKIIELSVVELRKLRLNLQKVQLQNSQLAQANSQMLAELNSGKDRLKVLQHDLACQNGLLKARKLEVRRKKVEACQKPTNEVAPSHQDESGQPCHENKENEPGNGNQGKRIRKQSLGCPPVKAANANKEANEKRRCSRRQSAWLKSNESEATEDSFEVNDAEFPVSSVHDEPVGTSSQILAEPCAKNDNNGNSASESFSLPIVNTVHAAKESDKRRCSRRQSARFIKTLQSEASEDSFETENAKFDVSSLHDNAIKASGEIILGLLVNEEDEGNPSTGFKTEESRRSSVGRPLRRAAENVQSYKEVHINIKMRRTQ